MTNRALYVVALLMLGGALSNCGTDLAQPSPAGPSVPIQPAPAPRPPIVNSVLADATLRGMVYEVVTDSRVGIQGVSVYCEQCGESTHTFAYTDATVTCPAFFGPAEA